MQSRLLLGKTAENRPVVQSLSPPKLP